MLDRIGVYKPTKLRILELPPGEDVTMTAAIQSHDTDQNQRRVANAEEHGRAEREQVAHAQQLQHRLNWAIGAAIVAALGSVAVALFGS